MRRSTDILMLAAAVLLAAALGGCLKVRARILLHEDGSATLTEHFRISQRLLDLGVTGGEGLAVADLLTKAAAERRLKHMGEGVRLIRHEVRDAENASRESVAVFRAADFRKLRYVSPFLAFSNYAAASALKCDLFPCYEDTWYGRRAGQMAVTFKPVTPEPRRRSRRPGDPPPPPGPTPKEQQIFRSLRPVFDDMLKDFRLELFFESYAPIRCRMYYRYRNMRAGTHEFPLIDFSHENMDRFGGRFLDNEEVTLELLRGKIAGANVVENSKGHADNVTVPVYHPRGVAEIYFNPSRAFFEKYFKGKTLHRDKRRGGDTPARWEAIGYKARTSKGKSTGK